jgi:DNA-binding transcriptional ArsR family regulator
VPDGRVAGALGHPLRVALLDLMSRRPTLTSNQAARELGESSGACSFHLRQLERYGQVEAAPGRGRERPWRLAPQPSSSGPRPAGPPRTDAAGPGDEFGELARELENEGYRRWLAGRATAPPGWHDEAFSAVLYLTPAELAEVAAAIRSVIATFERESPHRDRPPACSAGPAAARDGADPVIPVGVVARLFPLLPATSDGGPATSEG